MTRKLFYEDPYQKTFDGTVLACRQGKKGYEVLLDQTVFYPEGGGQPCDVGVLGGIRVTEVHEKEGEIWHTLEAPLEEGNQVRGEIEWNRRFDLMQQHSGEHIVSGLIHARYGYNNIGFHLGSEVIEIDFDGEIPDEEIREIELQANRYVWENHELVITWPTPEELKTLEYRSKKELTGAVRIVSWPGADVCACCGTHVLHSGEIGQIVLISSMRAKGGVRIEMICGGRVLTYTNRLKEQNHRISTLLSSKWNETSQAVEKLQKECIQLKVAENERELEYVRETVAKTEGKGRQIFFEKSLSPDNTIKLCSDTMEICGGLCAVFVENPSGGYRYVIGLKDGNLKDFNKKLNAALNGRGGGRPFFIQGSLQSSEAEIRKFLEENEI